MAKSKHRTRSKWYVATAILLVSLLTHFVFFGYPKEAVFDEVYFGKFISSYYTHTYYFDIHPPLGKLMISGFAKVMGYHPTSSFDSIGTKYTDDGYMILRFLPSLAGALLAPIIFLLALELGFDDRVAGLAGFLVAIENALIVQSRFILLDSFLLLFGFASLLLYLIYRRSKNLNYFFYASALAGAAASIKWTGLTFIALPLIVELVTHWSPRKLFPKKAAMLRALAFLIAPALLYIAVFGVHFALLTKSGIDDNFMSASFQRTLEGNQYAHFADLPTANIIDKFTELNRVMYNANQTLTAGHEYGSKWYSWPLMQRGVFYWAGSDRYIYLLGNPIIWWLSTIAVLVAVILTFTRRLKLRGPLIVLLFGYFMNLLPFIFISRVMFLYHYLIALVFAILILCYLIDQLKPDQQRQVVYTVGILAAASYLYFAPISYGLPLSQTGLNARMWLPTWR